MRTTIHPKFAFAVLSGLCSVSTGAPGDLLYSVQPPDVAPYDYSGTSVAIGENVVAVSSPGDNIVGIGGDVGSINFYNIHTGQHISKLVPDDAVEESGISYRIQIDGSLLIVRSTNPPSPAVPDTGASLYFYDISSPGAPVLLTRLDPPDLAVSGGFGYYKKHGDLLVIGSPYAVYDSEGGLFDSRGGAHLYDVSDPANPVHLSSFPGVYIGEEFGKSVAVEGNLVAFGAPEAQLDPSGVSSLPDQGAVYTYDITDPTAPVLLQRVMVPNVMQSTEARLGEVVRTYGGGVELLNGVLYAFDAHSKTVYSFDPMTGATIGALHYPITFRPDTMVREGTTIALAASNVDTPLGNKGVVMFLDISDPANMVETSTVYAPSETMGERVQFGTGLDFKNGLLAVGAPRQVGTGVNMGRTYVFDIAPLPEPCGPADMNADGSLNNTDINLFVNAFLAGSPEADLNQDTSYNNTDINLFVSLFTMGCM